MSKYKIILTPTGRFFFGGDQRFQIGDTKDEAFDSYIIQSRKFPQQTSLLGMLRFLILSNSYAFDKDNQKILDAEKSKELIGKESFKKDADNKFGKINAIGPCGLCKDQGDILYPVQLFNTDNGLAEIDKECSNYSPKNGIAITFGGIEESNIFKEDKRMGINRDIVTGKTEDSDLYKQIFYRLADGYSFAFEAEVDDVDLKKYDKQLVTVGGDSSQFIIGINSINDFQNVKTEGKGSSLALLSDAYIPKNVNGNCFAISDIVPFKCMQTKVESHEGSYNRLKKNWDYSDKLYLYKAGSVFFFENEEQLKIVKNEIDSHKDFIQIGYNHYQVK